MGGSVCFVVGGVVGRNVQKPVVRLARQPLGLLLLAVLELAGVPVVVFGACMLFVSGSCTGFQVSMSKWWLPSASGGVAGAGGFLAFVVVFASIGLVGAFVDFDVWFVGFCSSWC